MILVITGHFPVYDRQGKDTGKTEFTASHGVDLKTGTNVCLPCEHPSKLGAKYDYEMGEWIIHEEVR